MLLLYKLVSVPLILTMAVVNLWWIQRPFIFAGDWLFYPFFSPSFWIKSQKLIQCPTGQRWGGHYICSFLLVKFVNFLSVFNIKKYANLLRIVPFFFFSPPPLFSFSLFFHFFFFFFFFFFFQTSNEECNEFFVFTLFLILFSFSFFFFFSRKSTASCHT